MKNAQFYLSLALTGLTLLCLSNAHGEGVGSSGGGRAMVYRMDLFSSLTWFLQTK